MKYEIGQKVETPLGVGVVKGVRQYQEPIYQIKFMESNFKVMDFEEAELKPYKTAHERLLDMGLHLKITKNWAGCIFSHEWWNDNNDRVVVFYVGDEVTTVYEANHDIMRIIPQYLEELNEK